MGTKTKNAHSVFKKSIGDLLHIKMLLGYADTKLGSRYTIGIKCFTTEVYSTRVWS